MRLLIILLIGHLFGCSSSEKETTNEPLALPQCEMGLDCDTDTGTDTDTGANACQAVTCESLEANCGSLPDGCGAMLDCGECQVGEVCGAQTPNQCCTPVSCESQDAECGIIPDGCNSTIDCGACPGFKVCGVNVPNRCDWDCQAKTCQELGATCGSIDDGCGMQLNCGACGTNEFCVSNACRTTDEDADDIPIYGDGTTFVERALFPVVREITHLEVVDLDGDGKLDLVGNGNSAFNSTRLFWAKNYGNKKFALSYITEERFGSNGERIQRFGVGDLDGDGDIDLVAGGRSTKKWYENLGEGRFRPHLFSTNNDDREHFALGDINNDGSTDIVACESGGWWSWLENDGNQNFTVHESQRDPERTCRNVWVGDLTNDGRVEVLVHNREGIFAWVYTSQDVWERTLIADNSRNSYTFDLSLKDYDGDGLVDLAYLTSERSIRLLKNMGGLNFETAAEIQDVSGVQVSLADVDDDGDLDLLWVTSAGRIWLSNNSGTSSAPVYESRRYYHYDVAGAHGMDVDGDGKTELVVYGDASAVNQLSIHYPNDNYDADGDDPEYFEWTLSSGDGAYPTDVSVVDFDGDGDLDAVTCSSRRYTIDLIENMGQGRFAPRTMAGAWVFRQNRWLNQTEFELRRDEFHKLRDPVEVVAADLTENGSVDIVTVLDYLHADATLPDIIEFLGNDNEEYQIAWYDSVSLYSSPLPLDLVSTNSVQLTDFNRNGRPDLIVTSDQSSSTVSPPPHGYIIWIELNGTEYQVHMVDRLYREESLDHVSIGDIDGDGDNDMLWSANDLSVPGSNNEDDYSHGIIALSENRGNGRFSRYVIDSEVKTYHPWNLRMALLDIDEDGDLDIVAGPLGRRMYFYLNDGSGRFMPVDLPEDAVHPWTREQLLIADINGDGREDIVSSTGWFENEEGLEFVYHEFQDREREAVAPKEIVDFDGDGDLDIVTNRNWFENIGDNCPTVPNPDQLDSDEDGIGDLCER